MALQTTLEKLEAAQAARMAAEKAQAYSDGRNSKQMANLKVLYAREAQLERQLERETNGGRRVQYVNPER